MKTLKVLGVVASTLSSVLAMEYNDENKQPTDTNFTQYEDAVLTPPYGICGVISGTSIRTMVESEILILPVSNTYKDVWEKQVNPGTMTLSGPNTYTDGIIIDVRTLSLSATNTYDGGQLVISGETLKVEEYTASGLNDTLDVEAQHN